MLNFLAPLMEIVGSANRSCAGPSPDSQDIRARGNRIAPLPDPRRTMVGRAKEVTMESRRLGLGGGARVVLAVALVGVVFWPGGLGAQTTRTGEGAGAGPSNAP